MPRSLALCIHIQGFTSPVVTVGDWSHSCTISKHDTNDLSVVPVPSVVTDGSPLVVVEDLDATFVLTVWTSEVSVDKSNEYFILGLERGRWRGRREEGEGLSSHIHSILYL